MRDRINRFAGRTALVLSLIALGTITIGLRRPPEPPPADEGALAHIFQLAVGLLAPTLLVFFASADWRQPVRSVRPLVIPGIATLIAFGLLYYYEHVIVR